MDQILQIKNQAQLNGVENLEILDAKQINQVEPLIKSFGGLLVPSTGVIDQQSLMLLPFYNMLFQLMDLEDHMKHLSLQEYLDSQFLHL